MERNSYTALISLNSTHSTQELRQTIPLSHIFIEDSSRNFTQPSFNSGLLLPEVSKHRSKMQGIVRGDIGTFPSYLLNILGSSVKSAIVDICNWTFFSVNMTQILESSIFSDLWWSPLILFLLIYDSNNIDTHYSTRYLFQFQGTCLDITSNPTTP